MMETVGKTAINHVGFKEIKEKYGHGMRDNHNKKRVLVQWWCQKQKKINKILCIILLFFFVNFLVLCTKTQNLAFFVFCLMIKMMTVVYTNYVCVKCWVGCGWNNLLLIFFWNWIFNRIQIRKRITEKLYLFNCLMMKVKRQ